MLCSMKSFFNIFHYIFSLLFLIDVNYQGMATKKKEKQAKTLRTSKSHVFLHYIKITIRMKFSIYLIYFNYYFLLLIWFMTSKTFHFIWFFFNFHLFFFHFVVMLMKNKNYLLFKLIEKKSLCLSLVFKLVPVCLFHALKRMDSRFNRYRRMWMNICKKLETYYYY